ncbi:DNA-binding protein [Clostridium felsineum]|jgi:predicted HicB family RNase H-like nuclease|uniref:DNA-binding protein n=1 Tax=Clostridium felsineum TaxID=36839 RepID=UPI00214D3367|nr:DNA-binding protein [Clostridium felsineum]MCR3759169.1 DNA-binding protein [Clostridium felsineum]
MAISKDKVRSNLVIDKELKKQLEEIAKQQNRSFNNLIITILQEYILKSTK